MRYFTTYLAQIGLKIKSAQNLLKFGTFDISKIPISVLKSNLFFSKYIPIAGPKLAPK